MAYRLARARSGVTLLGLVLALGFQAGCRSTATEHPVSRLEAEQVLSDVVALATSGDLDALCHYPGVIPLECDGHLELAGMPVPAARPRVVADRQINPNSHNPGPGMVSL